MGWFRITASTTREGLRRASPSFNKPSSLCIDWRAQRKPMTCQAMIKKLLYKRPSSCWSKTHLAAKIFANFRWDMLFANVSLRSCLLVWAYYLLGWYIQKRSQYPIEAVPKILKKAPATNPRGIQICLHRVPEPGTFCAKLSHGGLPTWKFVLVLSKLESSECSKQMVYCLHVLFLMPVFVLIVLCFSSCCFEYIQTQCPQGG